MQGYIKFCNFTPIFIFVPSFKAINIILSCSAPEKVRLQEEVLESTLGNVVGMCRFRDYLSGTCGEKVLQFWIDMEQLNITAHSKRNRREALWREIQLKYFATGGLIKLKHNEMWDVLRGINHENNYPS